MLRPAIVFQFTQGTPSDTWVIQHNLSGNGSSGLPVVDVFIDYEGEVQKVLPLGISFDNSNQCTVTFSQPHSGYAIVIV